MLNKAMLYELQQGKTLDVRREGREFQEGLFELKRFVEGKDYCDSLRERWIWSVGRHVSTGQVVAACDARFYQNPNWECLYLR